MELKGYNNSNETKKILDKLLNETKDLRQRRGYVFSLHEFISNNLLGINVKQERNVLIKIRLRLFENENEFFPYYHILGTFIHEMCHMEVCDHGENFKKLENELHNEYDNDNNEFLNKLKKDNKDKYCLSSSKNKGYILGGKKCKSRLLDLSSSKLGGTKIAGIPASVMAANAALARNKK